MTRARNILAEYREDFARINEELEAFLHSRVSLVEDMGNHALLGEGKRLRPLLFLMSCRLLDFWRGDLYRISTIFEYIHAASLLHDDVIDNSQVRRKKPTANYLWGNHAAVLEGDFLYSKAMTLAVETHSLEFLRVLTDATVQMAEGQVLELAHQNDWGLSADKYMEIIKGKTAVLISAASSSAGIIAGAQESAIHSLGVFGLNVGMAFQLIDDILDYVSTEEVFGKPVGKDLKEGKITLPLIYTLDGLEREERMRFKEVFSSCDPGKEALTEVISLVRKGGAIEKVRKEAGLYLGRAAHSLEDFPHGRAREHLLELNQYLIDRDF
ncbi:MAG: polyprenyl synthetase family protein [Desulfobacteraceae bacterium]|jgi:octaprenyl-diphosphate synthase|nr:MAG: polyprenyl synthetase family protein [Desulfobacteraceae bacterium]